MSLALSLLPLLLQVTPTQPMPKGTGLPPVGTEEASVMTPVNTLFAALAARDGEMAKAALLPGGGATIVEEAADGTRKVVRISFDQFTAGLKPGPEKFAEVLYSPAIEIDGDIALVWGRYNFFINGQVHHCGYDLFNMVRVDGRWKIASITWNERTQGCTAE